MSKKYDIYLSPPHLEAASSEYVEDAIRSNWIAPVGSMIDSWEEEIFKSTGRYPVLTTSGEAALELGLRLLGVGRDDMVITSTHTCNATLNAIVHIGGVPVLVDSEKDSWNMDPGLLREALSKLDKEGVLPKVKAIMPVHIYGSPGYMTEIANVAGEYSLPVIEDAAEAAGSRIGDSAAGAVGELGVYSFNGNKIITTGGGGVLLCRTKEQAEHALYLATQAKDPKPWFEHTEIGHTYRMSNILAAIGLGQWQVLENRVTLRRGNFERYMSWWKKMGAEDMMVPQGEISGTVSNRWLSAFLLNSEDHSPDMIIERLAQSGIEARRLWKPMHEQPVFRGLRTFGGSVASGLFSEGICLPSGTNYSEENLNQMYEVFTDIFG